jgi:HEAT repeat protein
MTAGDANVERLGKLLRHRRAAIRESAVETLGKARSKVALRLLLQQAADPHLIVRARLAESLGGFRSAASERALRTLLSDADDLVRLNAAEALGQAGTSKSTSALLRVARGDRDPLVRAYAVESLGRLRASAVKGALRRRLESEASSTVRLRLVDALYRLGDRRRWRELIDFLDDDDYRVRAAAAAMLEDRMSPSRRAVIRKALQDRLTIENTEAVRGRLEAILSAME